MGFRGLAATDSSGNSWFDRLRLSALTVSDDSLICGFSPTKTKRLPSFARYGAHDIHFRQNETTQKECHSGRRDEDHRCRHRSSQTTGTIHHEPGQERFILQAVAKTGRIYRARRLSEFPNSALWPAGIDSDRTGIESLCRYLYRYRQTHDEK